MKISLKLILFFIVFKVALQSYAAEQVVLTTAEAKKKCKEEGKQGQALIDCIKDKKGNSEVSSEK